MTRVEFERLYGGSIPSRFWFGYSALEKAEDVEAVYKAYSELYDTADDMLISGCITTREYFRLLKIFDIFAQTAVRKCTRSDING